MKVTKEGIKLAKNERRVHNFIVKNEATHIKIMDINSAMTHRISKSMNVGRFIEIALKDNKEEWLHAYSSLLWIFSNVVTDEQFFEDVNNACLACINRHKDLSGIKEDIGKKEDDEILHDVKDTHEVIEKLKEEE